LSSGELPTDHETAWTWDYWTLWVDLVYFFPTNRPSTDPTPTHWINTPTQLIPSIPVKLPSTASNQLCDAVTAADAGLWKRAPEMRTHCDNMGQSDRFIPGKITIYRKEDLWPRDRWGRGYFIYFSYYLFKERQSFSLQRGHLLKETAIYVPAPSWAASCQSCS